MDILIAILWYLQLIFTGGTYSESEINALVIQNQSAIEQVQNNAQLMNSIIDSYNNTINNSANVLEQWKDPLPEPIRK